MASLMSALVAVFCVLLGVICNMGLLIVGIAMVLFAKQTVQDWGKSRKGSDW